MKRIWVQNRERHSGVDQSRPPPRLGDLPAEVSLRFLDLVDRYHATADGLEKCGRMIGALRIKSYCGDYGL